MKKLYSNAAIRIKIGTELEELQYSYKTTFMKLNLIYYGMGWSNNRFSSLLLVNTRLSFIIWAPLSQKEWSEPSDIVLHTPEKSAQAMIVQL